MAGKKGLFPPFLNQGSSGAAVSMLQVLLHALGYGDGVECGGEYESNTSEAVKKLQRFLGFAQEDVDGNMGPKTRAALWKKIGINLDWIPPDVFGPLGGNSTDWVDPDGNMNIWNPGDSEEEA